MILRILIGAACVAVIGFVGFAAWERYASPQFEFESKRAEDCAFDRQRIGRVTATTEELDRSLIENCIKDGY